MDVARALGAVDLRARRTDRDAPKHKGLSYLLVPMDQPGRIEIRPIVQITGHSEFNETFFDGARTAADERRRRGERRLAGRDGHARVRARRVDARPAARRSRASSSRSPTSRARTASPPIRSFRQRLADAWITLRVMRFHALRTLPMLEHGTVDPATSIHKLLWATFHRGLGELAVDVLGRGARSRPTPAATTASTRLFLYSRADTIYGGSNQIQRNVIGEQALGLPKEPR